MTTDERLIRMAAEGDDTALRELFDRHAPWVAARLRRTMPAHAVEDILQETFIAVWRGAKGYRGKGDVGAWIWGIARKQAAMQARKHGRPEPHLEPAGSEDPAHTAASSTDLAQALQTLGPEGTQQRELARLILIEDRPIAEVAEIFNVPEGTVKSRLYRVRRQLRTALGEQ